MEGGALFLGVLFLIVAAYLFITQTDLTVKWGGGGILAVMGVLVTYAAFHKKKRK